MERGSRRGSIGLDEWRSIEGVLGGVVGGVGPGIFNDFLGVLVLNIDSLVENTFCGSEFMGMPGGKQEIRERGVGMEGVPYRRSKKQRSSRQRYSGAQRRRGHHRPNGHRRPSRPKSTPSSNHPNVVNGPSNFAVLDPRSRGETGTTGLRDRLGELPSPSATGVVVMVVIVIVVAAALAVATSASAVDRILRMAVLPRPVVQ